MPRAGTREDIKEEDTMKSSSHKKHPRSQAFTTGSKIKLNQDDPPLFRSSQIKQQSPPLIRMKSTEMSPLIETIEVSEDLLRGGQTDMASDISNTPSEWGNGNYLALNEVYSLVS